MEKSSNDGKQRLTNILFFSPYFFPYISGITQYPYRLFSNKELNTKTTCLTFKHDPFLKTKEKINEYLTIYRMPFIFRISKGFISPLSFFYFWNEAKKADIVVLNLPSFEGIMLAFIAKLLKKPLLVFLHCEVQLPFSFINILVNIILNWGVTLQLLLANTIIVETIDYFKDKSAYVLFKHKMEEVFPLVNRSISDLQFKIKLNALTNKYPHVIGFCGRISAEKGIEILIESISSFKNVLLVFAGPSGKKVAGEQPYGLKIKKILDKKKIKHIFLGTLTAEELASFYSSIDILVLPSVNKTEAFGMVQVEAMLQGTPVIASNLPGVRMPVLLTSMGILTQPRNSRELTQAIRDILDHRTLYTNKKLTDKVKIIFDSKKTYNNISSIIHNTLQ